MTNLVHWSPFRAFADIERDLDRAWNGNGNSPWMPAVDVRETENAYLVEADLPGLKKEDIDVQVHDNIVTIRGERKQEEQEDKDRYARFERRYGRFERSFRLSDRIDTGKVEASYRDGVLRLELAKREEAKPRQIEVRVK
jgi:HSP20 family protein